MVSALSSALYFGSHFVSSMDPDQTDPIICLIKVHHSVNTINFASLTNWQSEVHLELNTAVSSVQYQL